MEPNPKNDLRKKWPELYGRYAALGFQMAGSVLFFTWLGLKADRHFDFKYPVLTITGSIIGIVAAFYFLFKQTKPD
jgi:hypothetical protein